MMVLLASGILNMCTGCFMRGRTGSIFPIEGASSHPSNWLPPSLPQDPERFPSEDDLQVVLDEISEYREFQ